ncbi:MAG TPA: ABC transporter permease subunit [Mycobacteriales bacterium]|nr:ABC transporter permease subunit [Mycobacteriales bacterium]
MLPLAAGAPNPWFGTSYIEDYYEDILAALREHVVITIASVLLGLLLSIPLALLAQRSRVAEGMILGTAGVIYAIPSISLLLILYGSVGLGLTMTTVIVALTLYNLLILVRNVLTGLRGVPEEAKEAATGMGLGATRRILKVELPLALPSIMAGVRIATVNTVALVTIGFAVGHGGLGGIITIGFKDNLYRQQVLTGVVLVVLLAIVLDVLLLLAQRLVTPWTRAEASR